MLVLAPPIHRSATRAFASHSEENADMASIDALRDRLARMSEEELESLEASATLTPEELALVRRERDARAGDLIGSDAAPVSVVVRDFDMPFTHMVLFMVKWAVASIPAVLILLTISILVAGLLIGFIREFR